MSVRRATLIGHRHALHLYQTRRNGFPSRSRIFLSTFFRSPSTPCLTLVGQRFYLGDTKVEPLSRTVELFSLEGTGTFLFSAATPPPPPGYVPAAPASRTGRPSHAQEPPGN